MATIATNHTLEAASRLGTLIDTHAPDAGRQLGDWLRPWLRDAETLPDFSLALRLPARMIRREAQRLFERQNELEALSDLVAEARFERDQTASALRRKLIESRRMVTAFFGPRHVATLLGLEGATAHAHQHGLLLTQADASLKRLRDPERRAVPRTDSVFFDPAALAGEIEPLAAAFREAHDRCNEVRRTNAVRRQAKDAASAALDLALRGVVFLLKGSFLLIRRADLAQKIGKEVSM